MKYYSYLIKEESTLLDWFNNLKVAKNKINYLIDNNFCIVNGNSLNRESILKPNDYLFIDLSNYHNVLIKDTNKMVDILYEDDYIIAVDKPKGYIIYSDDNQITVNDIVGNYLKSKEEVCFPCHRLDTDTTGCLIFAKDIITLAYLSNIFESKDVTKEYLAIVEGKTNPNGTINLPIGKDRHVNNKMIISKTGKPATTKYFLEKDLKNKSLIKVLLLTGRTHQIRVHMSHIGHPLVGDQKYGAKMMADRPLLHCQSISFMHPYTEKKVVIKSKLPQDMSKLVK